MTIKLAWPSWPLAAGPFVPGVRDSVLATRVPPNNHSRPRARAIRAASVAHLGNIAPGDGSALPWTNCGLLRLANRDVGAAKSLPYRRRRRRMVRVRWRLGRGCPWSSCRATARMRAAGVAAKRVVAGVFLYIGASDLLQESYHDHPTTGTTAMTIVGVLTVYAAVRLANL